MVRLEVIMSGEVGGAMSGEVGGAMSGEVGGAMSGEVGGDMSELLLDRILVLKMIFSANHAFPVEGQVFYQLLCNDWFQNREITLVSLKHK